MLFLCLYVIFILPFNNGQISSYKAAVVEFATSNARNVQQRFAESFADYIKFIKQASNQAVDIIVFPEGGLTGLQLTRKETARIGVRIPDVGNLSLCLNLNTAHNQFLTELSCVAKNYKIYVVVNIIEQDDDGENIVYYSTNVVFDRDGVITARYRKINLYANEYVLTAGNSLTTFTTDFGVKFGMFISNDIMFKNPSSNILETYFITNIIYSTAWYSTNTIQHGYSKPNGVNLLAAGLSNPTKQNGGSGIYLHTGEISKQYVSVTKSSKMLVSNVPIVNTKRSLLNTCQNTSTTTYSKSRSLSNVVPVNISSYHYKAVSLSFEKYEVTETVCGTGHEFCCTFKIKFNLTGVPNYVYKLLVFKDTSLIPVEGCGFLTCLNDNLESCYERSSLPPSGIIFTDISINTISLVTDEDRPVMLLPDLTASNNYEYCTHKTGRKMKITISTTIEESDFLVFGVFILNYNLNNNLSNNLINWYLFITCTLIIINVVYKRSNIVRSLR